MLGIRLDHLQKYRICLAIENVKRGFPFFKTNEFVDNEMGSGLHCEKYHAKRFPLFKANKFGKIEMEGDFHCKKRNTRGFPLF